MMNCKPTLANMLSRENPNQFFPAVNFTAALPFGGEYDSGICVKEPISRQMANVSVHYYYGGTMLVLLIARTCILTACSSARNVQ